MLLGVARLPLGVARLLLGVTTPLLSSSLLASILLCLARFVLARWRAVFRGLGEGAARWRAVSRGLEEGALLLGRGLVGEGWGAPNVLLARLLRSWRFAEFGWEEGTVWLLEARVARRGERGEAARPQSLDRENTWQEEGRWQNSYFERNYLTKIQKISKKSLKIKKIFKNKNKNP